MKEKDKTSTTAPKDSTPPGDTPVENDPLVGKTIGGRYCVLKRLGRGGMGSVYSAEQVALHRKVAIKFLHSRLTENAEFMERFRREALIGSMLSHQNAVTLFDFGTEDNLPYLVMQYVEGETLKNIIDREGNLPLDRIINIMTQVCAALSEAHKLGIIHRDLKPDNIMVSKTRLGFEHVSVLDFGIAKPTTNLNDTTSVSLTRVDVVMGTPQYMSPEQAMNKELGPTSDIFSLGIILFEMLSGQVPYKGYSPVEILLKHVNETHVELPIIRPEYNFPKSVAAVVAKALSKNPTNRYRTVEEFESALRTAAKLESSSPAWQAKNNWKLIPILFGSTLIVLVGVFSLVRQKQRTHSNAKVGLHEKNRSSDRQVSGSFEEDGLELEPTQEPESPVSTELPTLQPTVAEVAAVPTTLPTPEVSVAEITAAPTELATAGPTSAPTEMPSAVPTEAATEIPTAEPTKALTELPSAEPTESESQAPTQTEPVLSSTTEPSDAATEVQPLLEQTPAAAPSEEPMNNAQLDELQSEARKLFENKKYVFAGVKFKKLLSHRPDSVPDRLSLGVCFLQLGADEKAYEHFNIALSQDSNYAPTYYNLASYYAHRGDVENAVKSLEHAIKLFPKIRSWLKEDKDFDNVRSDPRFKKIAGLK